MIDAHTTKTFIKGSIKINMCKEKYRETLRPGVQYFYCEFDYYCNWLLLKRIRSLNWKVNFFKTSNVKQI